MPPQLFRPLGWSRWEALGHICLSKAPPQDGIHPQIEHPPFFHTSMVQASGFLAYLDVGELVIDPPVAKLEMPGSCVVEVVVEVELGRDTGSSVVGNDVPSSIIRRMEGNAGDDVRAIGCIIGGRLWTPSDASADAVVRICGGSRGVLETRECDGIG
ncbi:hypothetical protein F4778DRAFT_212984 [Xylariomycetidae sp. FL2044]|nr:hypothetical protein F4778DRAFT_212984 [Xylariomycetidae sp. FL2044]